MAGQYVLKRSGTQFVFNLKGGNGETILTSERYTAKQSAENGIESCRTNSVNDARYERKTSSSGQAYFVLKAINSQVIGTSEMYSSAAARDNGIEACKRSGPTAPTRDET